LDPKVAVIGSSNMTVRAFGLRSDWNYEADVVIWDDKYKAANTLVSEVLQNDGDVGRASIIVSDYATSDKLNGGMGLTEKVESLVKEVLETSDPE
jgi:phosphatidylserine/phosphatidylglycerophosphate/cardiolipin synthase-like enzyme